MLIQPNTFFIGRQFIHLDVVDSTMNYASALLTKGNLPEGVVVHADFQVEGRGQSGNTWLSAAAQNLTFSFILFPTFLLPKRHFYLNMAVSLAVKATAEALTRATVCVKWPNDILIEEKKVAGILITSNIRGQQLRSAVVGIGLNVNQTQFPADLNNATSLCAVAGHQFDRQVVLELLCEKLEQYYLLLRGKKDGLLKEEYLQSLFGMNQTRRFHVPGGAAFEAEITGVEDSGLLCLRIGSTLRRFDFKEIVFD